MIGPMHTMLFVIMVDNDNDEGRKKISIEVEIFMP